jgi:hypothetical protein
MWFSETYVNPSNNIFANLTWRLQSKTLSIFNISSFCLLYSARNQIRNIIYKLAGQPVLGRLSIGFVFEVISFKPNQGSYCGIGQKVVFYETRLMLLQIKHKKHNISCWYMLVGFQEFHGIMFKVQLTSGINYFFKGE